MGLLWVVETETGQTVPPQPGKTISTIYHHWRKEFDSQDGRLEWSYESAFTSNKVKVIGIIWTLNQSWPLHWQDWRPMAHAERSCTLHEAQSLIESAESSLLECPLHCMYHLHSNVRAVIVKLSIHLPRNCTQLRPLEAVWELQWASWQ